MDSDDWWEEGQGDRRGAELAGRRDGSKSSWWHRSDVTEPNIRVGDGAGFAPAALARAEVPGATRDAPWWQSAPYWWQTSGVDETAGLPRPPEIITRRARKSPALPAPSSLTMESPPPEPRFEAGATLEAFIPSLILFAIFAAVSGTGHVLRTLLAMGIAAPLLVMSVLVIGRIRVKRQRRRDAAAYNAYLERLKTENERYAKVLREGLTALHPPPGELHKTATTLGSGLWVRLPGDRDFLRVSLGVGEVENPLCISLSRIDSTARAPREDLDAIADSAWRAFAKVAHCEVEWDVLARRVLVAAGSLGPGLARAVAAELVVGHGHDHLAMAVAATGAESAAEWAWTNQLPHVLGIGDALSAASTEGWTRNLARLFDERRRAVNARDGATDEPPRHPDHHLVVIVPRFDGATTEEFLLEAIADPLCVDASFLILCDDPAGAPSNAELLIASGPEGATLTDMSPSGVTSLINPRACDSASVSAIGKALATTRLRDIGRSVEVADSPRLFQALNISSAEDIDIARRERRHRLAVPLGITSSGELIYLDLRERALSGNGPHGVLGGATGYGKSALLRSMIAGLVATHTTDEVALLLVDYKGGETFDAFSESPHLAGFVTDIAGDAGLIDRLGHAIDAEVDRRKKTLAWVRDNKPFDIGELSGSELVYAVQEWAAETGESRMRMPSLIVAIDEFGELLANHPGLADQFATVCRQGRSIGMHFLFATQQLEQRDVRTLNPHLSWRICLHMNSVDDAREVLGTPDLPELPDTPGAAILRTGAKQTRFKAIHADRMVVA